MKGRSKKSIELRREYMWRRWARKTLGLPIDPKPPSTPYYWED